MSDKIENTFKHHPPKGTQSTRYEGIRHQAKALAYVIDQHCPERREKDLGMMYLEHCVMWANKSIAVNE